MILSAEKRREKEPDVLSIEQRVRSTLQAGIGVVIGRSFEASKKSMWLKSTLNLSRRRDFNQHEPGERIASIEHSLQGSLE